MENIQKSTNVSSSPPNKEPNNTLYTQVSDESFLSMEQICKDEQNFEDLLGSQEVPDLDDTLSEINFILGLGNKLKREGKLDIPNTRYGVMLNFDVSVNSFVDADSHEEETSGAASTEEKRENFNNVSKVFNEDSKLEEVSEISYYLEGNDSDNAISIDDSSILDHDVTQQSENESFEDTNISENGSVDDPNDESTLEDELCGKMSANLNNEDHIDLSEVESINETMEDSIIEIID